MKNFNRFMVVFSTLIILAVGAGVCGSVAEISWLSIETWMDLNKLATGAVGSLLFVLGLANIFLGLRELRPEPTISFYNPQGEVRVAFSAIEDFVKRLSAHIEEVRELKPKVMVAKKGLEIYNRVTLAPNINIPEASLKIQETIKSHVQDVLGIKDITAIKVLIVKIAPEAPKKKVKEEKFEEAGF